MFNVNEATGKATVFAKVFDNNFNELLNVLKSDKAWHVHENIDSLDFNNTSTVIAQRGTGSNMISVWNRGTDEATKKWGVDFGVRVNESLMKIPAVAILFSGARKKVYNKGKKVEYRISTPTLYDALYLAYTVASYEATYTANSTKEIETIGADAV